MYVKFQGKHAQFYQLRSIRALLKMCRSIHWLQFCR